MSDPLIITVTLENDAQDYFTELRTRYFPKHCNYLSAHMTLFHHLPQELPGLDQFLSSVCERDTFDMQVSGIKNIGNGVAFSVVADELQRLHQTMQKQFDPYLIRQDRQKLWPHITVQNKVTAWKAKQTELLLSETFVPFAINTIGLQTWIYKGGPWEKGRDYLFEER